MDDAITFTKVTVKGYSTEDGASSGGDTSLVFSKEVSTYAAEMSFEGIGGQTGLYYRFEFELSVSNSKNKGLIVDSIDFYEITSVTGLSISPLEDVTIPNGGGSKTFTLKIEGIGLTGEEEATLSLGADVDGLTLSVDKVKNGENFVVTATAAGVTAELSATYGEITSNKVTIKTEEAKSPESLALSGSLTKPTYFVGESFDPTGLTATVTFSDKTTKDVTEGVAWSLGTISADTTSATASYTENGVTVTASVDINVRVLSSITVDANPNLTYEEGDFLDLAGMVVTKHYNDGYSEACTDYTTSPKAGDKLAKTNASLTVSLDGVSDVVLPLTVNDYTAKQYEIVTSDPGDLSGTYLIVYKSSDTEGYAFNCEDAASGYNAVALNGTKITASEKMVDEDTVTLSKTDGGYSIMVNGGANAGKYIYGKKDDNQLNFSAASSDVTVSFNKEDGSAEITSNTSVFRFNSNSGQNRFRFFKSSGYSSQKTVYLYKQVDASSESGAKTWAQSFLDGTKDSCVDYNADNYDKLNADSVWASLETSYKALSEADQNTLKSQVANGDSTDPIEQAMARYDHIVNRYSSLNDFIGRRTSASAAKSAFFGNSDNNGTNLALAITFAVATAALSATFIIRKKKQDR